MVILLLLATSAVFYQIFSNYVPYNNFVFAGKPSDAKIYFLTSNQTIEKLSSFGIEKDGYIDRLKKIENMLIKQGFAVQYIAEDNIPTLPRGSTLFALDTISLSDKSVKEIENYMAEGGFLVFNYHFAYNSADEYRDSKVVQRITGLKPSKLTKEITSGGNLYLMPRLLSPITQTVTPFSERIELYTADPIPLFTSDNGLEPDVKLSNWGINSTPVIENEVKDIMLDSKEVGTLWHGTYKKGNWAYFSFPSYCLFSVENSKPMFSKLLHGIITYSNTVATMMTFPYIDAKKVVFISEDTEYKFRSFENFINAAEKYKIPVTAFIVSSLAEKDEYLPLLERAKKSPYLEIASHSHTHQKILGTSNENIKMEIAGSKKIIDQLTHLNLTGFRPPREEIGGEMVNALKDAGYEYLLEKNKGYLYPRNEYNGLYLIPRTATDDYQFLVNLEWGQDEIVSRMIFETEYITSMDGLYSLSVHTHLMAYKNNIQILEKYFAYLKSHPEYTALSGEQLIDRVKQREKISYGIEQTDKNFIITVDNENIKPIDSMTFRVFWTQPIQIKNIQSEIMGVDIKYSDNPTYRYTDITIASLKPLSNLKLFVQYEAN